MDPHAKVDRRFLTKRGENKRFECRICGFRSVRLRAFDAHSERVHFCSVCRKYVAKVSNHHCSGSPASPSTSSTVGGGPNRDGIQPGVFAPQSVNSGKFALVSQGHHGTVSNYRHSFTRPFVFVESAMNFLYSDVVSILMQFLKHFKNIKVLFKLLVRLLDTKGGDENVPTATPYMTIRHPNYVRSSIKWGVDYMINTLNLFNENGSGCTVDFIISFEIQILQLRELPIRGYIPTPAALKGRHGLLNIMSKRSDCYMLSVLAFFYQKEITSSIRKIGGLTGRKKSTIRSHETRARQLAANYYDFIGRAKSEYKLSFDGFDKGVTLADIDDFEMRHSFISINVYGIVGKNPFSLRIASRDATHHINLLLLQKCDLPPKMQLKKRIPDSHFVLISNLDAFVADGHVKGTRCKWCLSRHISNDTKTRHEEKCQVMHELKIQCYDPGTRFNFIHLSMKMDVYFRIYFDLECFNVKYPEREPKVDETKLTYTRAESNFQVSAFGLSVVDGNRETIYQRYYAEENVMEEFIKTLLCLEKKISDEYKTFILPCNPTRREINDYIATVECEECGQRFGANNPKVMHHDHHRARGPVIAICRNCNLKIQQKTFIPVICHNGQAFDNLFILKALTPSLQKRVTLVPKNTQQFMSISIGSLRILDSCLFLPSSLEKLVERLKGSGSAEELKRFDAFVHGFNNHPDIALLFKKQHFCYDYLDGPARLSETSLPPHKSFYNTLNESNITREEYEHCQLVWDRFNCETLKDYMILYLKCDVLLLQVVFENFLSTCQNIYGLSPLFSYSLPGYAYMACMYTDRQNWEYPSDPAMIKLVRDNIRGGICYASQRLATSCSEDLGDVITDPDQRQEILYLDFVNLYGWAMLQLLPHSEYKWLTRDEIDALDFTNLPEQAGKGWIYEVDLDYDPAFHDLHDSMPLAPHKLNVELEQLSPHQRYLVEIFEKTIKNPMGSEKLLLTFYKKEKYACYDKLLKFYLSHGMKVVHCHSAFSFTEKSFLRNYIEMNISLRQNATDEFTKALYKLLINAIFGKMLNIRSRTNAHFCNSRTDALKHLAAHNFKSILSLTEDTSIFFMEGEKVKVNKPLFAGFCVLELSKLKMYETYYDVLQKKFGGRIKNLYSDTDSMVLLIKDREKTLTQDLLDIKGYFDFSNLNQSHPLYSPDNKAVPGKLKLEYIRIRQFIALKAKVYSILFACEKCSGDVEYDPEECTTCHGKELQEIRCKGVPRKALKKISHAKMLEYLFNHKILYVRTKAIRGRNCVLELVETQKVGVHDLDIRRYMLANNIDTLAFGNYRIFLDHA